MLLAAVAVLAAVGPARAADEVGPNQKDVRTVVDKALKYLEKRQGKDGSFSPRQAGPGVTALVVAAAIRAGRGTDDPLVSKGLDYLKKSVKKDGGIYDRGLANYTTCIAVMAFAEANKDGKYDTLIKNATAFLKKLQNDDANDKVKFGGLGY